MKKIHKIGWCLMIALFSGGCSNPSGTNNMGLPAVPDKTDTINRSVDTSGLDWLETEQIRLVNAYLETKDTSYLDSLLRFYQSHIEQESADPWVILYTGLLAEHLHGYDAAEPYYRRAQRTNKQKVGDKAEEPDLYREMLTPAELEKLREQERLGQELLDAYCDLALKKEHSAQEKLARFDEKLKQPGLGPASFLLGIHTREDLLEICMPLEEK